MAGLFLQQMKGERIVSLFPKVFLLSLLHCCTVLKYNNADNEPDSVSKIASKWIINEITTIFYQGVSMLHNLADLIVFNKWSYSALIEINQAF